MIPFNNLHPAIYDIRPEIDAAIERVVDSGVFLGGKEVEAFESEWAAYCGAKYCVACASGTDALMLAQRVFCADSLMVPANGCKFTITGLMRGGAEVEAGDVDEHGMRLDQNTVAVLLYGRGKHQYGIDGRRVLFDACQAHGWKPPIESLAAWSFYPTKNLGTFGDAGAVTCWRAADWSLMKMISTAHHSRMSELNAAILRTKLPHLDRWNAERAAIAEVYYNELPDWAEPVCRPGEPTNHHIFAVLVDRRDELENHLTMNGIGHKVHYREPLADLPGANRWCSRVLSLPMWPGLKAEEVRTVCDAIKVFK